MKTYLISGLLVYFGGEQRHFSYVRTLGFGECMNAEMLVTLQESVKQENNRTGTIAKAATILAFQQLESTPPVPPAELHLNECSVVLPPVGSPLLIEIAPGVLLRAKRPAHVPQRDDLLMFDLDAGGMYVGRPRWTHP